MRGAGQKTSRWDFEGTEFMPDCFVEVRPDAPLVPRRAPLNRVTRLILTASPVASFPLPEIVPAIHIHRCRALAVLRQKPFDMLDDYLVLDLFGIMLDHGDVRGERCQ
jgi:hypothetical protein